MKKLSDVIVISVTRETYRVSRTNFGVALFLLETTAFVPRVVVGDEVSDLADLGIGENEPAYAGVDAHLKQAYKPEQFKLGRKGKANQTCKQRVLFNLAATGGTFTITLDGQTTAALAYSVITTAGKAAIETALEALPNVDADGVTVTVDTDYQDFYIEFDNNNDNLPFELVSVDVTNLTTTTASQTLFMHQVTFDAAATGGTFTITVNGETTNAISHTALTSATKQDIIDALTNLPSIYTDGIDVTIETAATIFRIEFTGSNYGMTVSSLTVDVTSLTSVTSATVVAAVQGQASESWSEAYEAVKAYDSAWFVLLTPQLRESGDYSDQNSLADKMSSELTKFYGINTQDSTVASTTYSATTPSDIAEYIRANNYKNCTVFYTEKSDSYIAEAIFGRQLSLIPGSSTYALKALTGVTVDDLTDTEVTNIEGKYCNYYVELAGEGTTFNGQTGSGTYIDDEAAIMYISTSVQENLYNMLKSTERTSYDAEGYSAMEANVRSSLKVFGVDNLLIIPNTITVTMPNPDDAAAVDKANRIVRTIRIGFTLKGAVQKVYVQLNIGL